MKIQHLFRALIVLLVLTTSTPALADKPGNVSPIEAEHATRLKQRLDEIKVMDKNAMTKAEKKALRSEVRAIKKELQQISGGVYLSVGAVLLILLLILLLA